MTWRGRAETWRGGAAETWRRGAAETREEELL